MPAFTFEALDAQGQTRKGILEADNARAARSQLRVDVDYVSLSSAEQSGRNIVPHTLVYDGIRWHVRAYCEKKGE